MITPRRSSRSLPKLSACLMLLLAYACDDSGRSTSPVDPGAGPSFSGTMTPGIPTPRAPANGAVVTPSTGKLEWSAISGAQVYRYMVAERRELLPGDPNAGVSSR